MPSPSPSPSLLLSPLLSLAPAMPAEPTSADKVNEDKDENIKEPVKVKDEDIGLPSLLLLLPLPVRFSSV